MKNSHFIVAFGYGGLDVKARFEAAVEVGSRATGKHFCAFLLPDIERIHRFIKLVSKSLCAHHHCFVEGGKPL
jgi:hypothetical protein